MLEIKRIGMYSTDEILEFMTNGEGRSFLGRSMFDTMYFKIEELENINEKLSLALESAENKLQQKENIIKEVREYIEQDIKANYFKRYDDEVYKICDELLEILDKADKENNNEDN